MHSGGQEARSRTPPILWDEEERTGCQWEEDDIFIRICHPFQKAKAAKDCCLNGIGSNDSALGIPVVAPHLDEVPCYLDRYWANHYCLQVEIRNQFNGWSVLEWNICPPFLGYDSDNARKFRHTVWLFCSIIQFDWITPSPFPFPFCICVLEDWYTCAMEGYVCCCSSWVVVNIINCRSCKQPFLQNWNNTILNIPIYNSFSQQGRYFQNSILWNTKTILMKHVS